MSDIPEITIFIIAQRIKDACIEASRQGYENAAISGLCHEGAVEASISAVQMVDIKVLIADQIENS